MTTSATGEHDDELIVKHGVSWDAFETFLEKRGDALPRVAYLEGTLELMSPSRNHEIIRKRFAAVVEAYLNAVEVVYEGVGAWLLKNARRKAGLEPDECYILHDLDKPRPDLALEVVWTSGSIKKLEIYRRLEVGEVWIWKRGAITVHVLTDTGYELRTDSACIPGFDFALVAEMMELPSLSAVYKQLPERLAARR